MKVIFLRHGKTAGNLEGRYVGTTDQPLCPEGIAGLKARTCPSAARVVASPLLRCVQTAQIVYPGVPVTTHPGLRECDFGEFEGKNYAELNGRADYQAWIDSGGTLPFPGGEGHGAFCARCIAAFLETVAGDGPVAYVVHGGTIMAVLERFALPKGGFYDFQVKNGGGYAACWDGSALRDLEVL